ncbi:MAG: penicillin acylase family protein [Pyrinomonadaceae bacterium]|nr:penicillin acylase family protein [Pyrinomonadaceae bacterium]MBP6213930.1 penicillin acylase family protein [Pyrinomonadaceae bacterium]
MKQRFAATLFIAVFSSISVFTQTAPTRTSLTGLKSEVTIRRDARSIPYIEAANDADLYFAQGYSTASDRLFQMDLMRRVARGETAELFGNLTLEEDKRWRRFNFSRIVDDSIKFLSPELVAALDAYARGVNAYIATLDERSLPVEFRILQYRPKDWRSSDSLIIGKILSDALSTTWRNDLMRASMQGVSPQKLADVTNQVTPYDVILFGTDAKAATPKMASKAVAPSIETLAAADAADQIRRTSLERLGLYAEELAASNNWVISGKRTADGRAILANDPHLAATAPGIWYMAHLSTPTMRVSGVTLPGSPGIILGHNADIAWGATNVGPDVQDLFIETFNDKGEYKTPTGWQAATVRKEVINVRGNIVKPATTPVEFEVTETRNGPIILEDGGKRYALKWTAFDPKNNEIATFYRWNRARNWQDFTDALKSYGGAAQNFIYADTKGNIGWYAASRIPIRRVGDGALPYDGSTTDGDWVSNIPFDELPHLYNPPSGMIITANQRIVGTSFKYTQMSRDAAPPWRARAIVNKIGDKQKITFDDVRDAQHDTHNIPLELLAKEIVRIGGPSAETLAVLKAWDGRMEPDSRGALLANELRVCIANKIAEDNKPIPAYIIRERILERAIREKLDRWLPKGFSTDEELYRVCDQSVRATLSDPKRLGPDDTKWTWGTTWVSRFQHPLAAVPLIGGQFKTPSVAISGSGQTPNVGSAVSMRHIASPGNWDVTRHVIPLGQSGDPASPHFRDQFDLWRTGQPAIFPFTKPAVEKAAAVIMVMSPKK